MSHMGSVLVAIVAVICVVAGTVLVRIARFKRPIDERRCGRCNYILDRGTSGQCPECGAPASESRQTHVAVLGRSSRILTTTFGIASLAAGAFLLVVALLAVWVRLVLGLRG